MRSARNLMKRVAVAVGAVLAIGAGVAQAQVTYSLGTASDMFDGDFYDGKAAPGSATVQAPGGRTILNAGVNNAGTKLLVIGIDLAANAEDFFIVDVGDPSSWERLTYYAVPFEYSPIIWCADDIHVFAGDGGIFNTVTKVFTSNHELIPGYSYYATGITSKATDNWVFGNQNTGQGNIPAYPVLANGDGDPGRPYRDVTNFTVGPNDRMYFPSPTRDGESLVFYIADESGVPDVGNSYRLNGVNDILDGITSPPTSLADPRIVEIRASASPNYNSVPHFSFDGSLVLVSEDFNNLFNAQDFFNSLVGADWQIAITNADGTGFQQVSGGITAIPFPSSGRIHYVAQPTANPFEIHVYAATLTAENDIDAQTDPLPDNGTTAVIGGQPVTLPFVLSDSAVQTTSDVTVGDASGTTIELPTDQVINFPDGTAVKAISIVTPTDPVADIQLPDPATSIPVIRTFGPSGTQFEPPITITISYTDAEVANLADESSMIPYLFNTGTQQYEPLASQFLPSVVVDTVNNTLSFQTDHFSVYGIGGPRAMGAPQRPWTWVVLVAALMCAAGLLIAKNRRTARSPGMH